MDYIGITGLQQYLHAFSLDAVLGTYFFRLFLCLVFHVNLTTSHIYMKFILTIKQKQRIKPHIPIIKVLKVASLVKYIHKFL